MQYPAATPKRAKDEIAYIRGIIRKHKRWDLIFAGIGMLALLIGVVMLAGLFIDLVASGWSRLTPEFFTSFSSRRASNAGIAAAMVGTLLVILVTVMAAVPLGVGAGIYLEEYAPKNWFTGLIEINISNLAGVPSVVYGLLGLGLFVYGWGLDHSVVSAGLTLALLILPIVVVATREAIRTIPGHIREGAYALGATKWQLVAHHIIPYSSAGILTGIIIGVARAIGETAPLITIGAAVAIFTLPSTPFSSEFPFLSFEWLKEPFTVMPIQMFQWTSRPDHAFQINAAAAGVVLIVMTLALNGLAIYLRYRLRKNIKW
jgi:phosphate transport system permease protein